MKSVKILFNNLDFIQQDKCLEMIEQCLILESFNCKVEVSSENCSTSNFLLTCLTKKLKKSVMTDFKNK